LAGTIERDSETGFGLGVASRMAHYPGENRSLDGIGNEDEIDRCGRGWVIRASLAKGCGRYIAGSAGGFLCDCRHRAVMLAVAAAAHRHVRFCHGRSEERRNQRQREQQKKRDGDESAHRKFG